MTPETRLMKKVMQVQQQEKRKKHLSYGRESECFVHPAARLLHREEFTHQITLITLKQLIHHNYYK